MVMRAIQQLLVLLLAGSGICTSAYATDQTRTELKVATGISGGTYSRMLRELLTGCRMAGMVIEVNTSGASENLERLSRNEVELAFVKEDSLHRNAARTEVLALRTVIALHAESLHLVALRPIAGNNATYPSSLADLGGRKVGAAGGATNSAEQLRNDAGIAFEVERFRSSEESLTALLRGQVQAVLLVGGQPLRTVQLLDGRFTLIPIPLQALKSNVGRYVKVSLGYPRLSSDEVSSITSRALIAARAPQDPDSKAAILSLRRCANVRLPQLSDPTAAAHPFWRDVTRQGASQWPAFQ